MGHISRGKAQLFDPQPTGNGFAGFGIDIEGGKVRQAQVIDKQPVQQKHIFPVRVVHNVDGDGRCLAVFPLGDDGKVFVIQQGGTV